MRPYRAKPHCSHCGSLRNKWRLQQHNELCAANGERSYMGQVPKPQRKRLLVDHAEVTLGAIVGSGANKMSFNGRRVA